MFFDVKNLNFKLVQTILFTLTIFSLMKKSLGQACFESKEGNDYSLDCGRMGESKIVSQLFTNCGAYNDGLNDCAEFFIQSMNFGKSLFGYSICTLSTHETNSFDPCIVQTVRNDTKNNFVTDGDIWTLVGIGTAALCVLTCLLIVFKGLRQNTAERPAAVIARDYYPEVENGGGQERQSLVINNGTNNNGAQIGAQVGVMAVDVVGTVVLGALSHCNVM